MSDLSCSPDDYASSDSYAYAMATLAVRDPDQSAIGGGEGWRTELEFAIEPSPGDCARGHETELAGPIEELPIYAAGARIITRGVTYGPWRYVAPEEIEAG